MSDRTTWSCSWLLQNIDFFGTPVPIHVPETISLEELEGWKPFISWKTALHQNLTLQASPFHAFYEHPYSPRNIEIQSVDRFGSTKIGFVKLKATIERDELPGDKKDSRHPKPKSAKGLPGVALLRGDSVAILMILRPRDSREERYVVLTE